MLDHFFPLLFPKDSESLKILDIRLRKVGTKRPLNGTPQKKVKRQTDRQTDRRTDGRTDGRTFRLIKSIGQERRCFENWKVFQIRTKYFFYFLTYCYYSQMLRESVSPVCRIFTVCKLKPAHC